MERSHRYTQVSESLGGVLTDDDAESKNGIMKEIERLKIEKKDDDGVLSIYHYRTCNNESSDSVKRYRGIIVDVETKEIVYASMPYIDVLTEVPEDVQGYDFITKSYEGTLLRVFFYKEKWYIATHKKLDAYRSRWGSVISFGAKFQIAVEARTGSSMEECLARLSKECMHLFLLENDNETRIVCRNLKPSVYYVGTISRISEEKFLKGDFADVFHFPSTSSNLYFELEDDPSKSWADLIDEEKEEAEKTEWMGELPEQIDGGKLAALLNKSESEDYLEFQGYICRSSVTGKEVKVVFKAYKFYSDMRGNEVNIPYRYLQIRGNEQYVKAFPVMYPEYRTVFSKYELIINDIVHMIYDLYVERHIKKRFVYRKREIHMILKSIHALYLEYGDRVDRDLVRIIVNEQSAAVLNKLIQMYE